MRMSETDWDLVMNVNVKSVFNHIKAIQPYFLKQRKGSIINLGSVVGISGNAGQANYAASKAAIIGLSKSIAKELGSRNIRCNVIAPGFIETEMTHVLSQEVKDAYFKTISLRRGGLPEDVANTALFLASNLSAYITGQVIVCDGGM
jgi:3-oxoacyl-[acyl-carrier protein] reductase